MKTRKDVFSVLGEVKIVEGKKRFVPKSPAHLTACISRLPTGKELSCTFSIHVASRSSSQLAYHFVLLNYIAEHTGHSAEELHDGIMRIKFGEKRIKIGGQYVLVRASISDKAHFPKYKMVELIEKDLEICKELGIKIPTPEELGYISNSKPMR